ncbi:late embryogenesis abundant protein D-34-like [Typha latifolia]|uniref:late embryogenesis abundant protein D-34-like n=1 Tax=Typha latifolia TaxID=4733 RepID=UPI003C2F375A
MSQQQPRRPLGADRGQGIKYGDVFSVTSDLAGQPIAPKDAVMMQSAENIVLGQTQKDGPAASMLSAAACNERAGVVCHDQVSDVPRDQGITATETPIPGGRVVTEFLARQVVGQYVTADNPGGGVPEGTKITIGEAMEAAALTAGDQPVEPSDLAAIQAAELRATGFDMPLPGGVADQAQAAASANVSVARDDDKIKLRDVLSDATVKLPADKPVEIDDAAAAVGMEIRNKPDMIARPGGVASSLAAAARLNQYRQ